MTLYKADPQGMLFADDAVGNQVLVEEGEDAGAGND